MLLKVFCVYFTGTWGHEKNWEKEEKRIKDKKEFKFSQGYFKGEEKFLFYICQDLVFRV